MDVILFGNFEIEINFCSIQKFQIKTKQNLSEMFCFKIDKNK